MLLSIFSPLYECTIGQNNDYPEYRQEIFNSVGILTLIIAVVFCLIFYLALGRWKEIWYNRTHWSITIVILAGMAFGLALMQTKGTLHSAIDSYLIQFSSFNALYAVIYFVVFSFLFKNFSIYSKRTPI